MIYVKISKKNIQNFIKYTNRKKLVRGKEILKLTCV